jgi:hypothetical protein
MSVLKNSRLYAAQTKSRIDAAQDIRRWRLQAGPQLPFGASKEPTVSGALFFSCFWLEIVYINIVRATGKPVSNLFSENKIV